MKTIEQNKNDSGIIAFWCFLAILFLGFIGALCYVGNFLINLI